MSVNGSSFATLGLSEPLLGVLDAQGFAAPTPIQAAGIPHLLAGGDLIGQAKTGSGKTAAFAIPLLERLDIEQRAVQALVLCPTRDLCTQVAGELRQLGRYRANLRVLIVAGGQPLGPQAQALERGAQIVVATPGRLLDHLRRGLDLGGLRSLVLDEADRMLDMGFRADIETVLAQLPRQRQTVLFSATFPTDVLELSARYQRNALQVAVQEAAPAIEQWRVQVMEAERPAAVLALLVNVPAGAVMVFCNTKQAVDELSEYLRRAGVAADRLHGGLEQPERDLAMARFRNGSSKVLVATDVAARGLDIAGLAAVINFELPMQPETYVHRIGRTGRAGRPGVAVSLHGPQDSALLAAIEDYVGAVIASRALPPRRRDSVLPTASMRTLLIVGGRKDKLRPGDILGALTGEGGLEAARIGRIEIGERLSYVAVAAQAAPVAIQCLRAGRIKGRRFRIHLPA